MSDQKWITDEMPDKYGEYFITWVGELNGRQQKPCIEIAEYEPESGDWLVEHIEKRGWHNVKVTAWMELPDPYI